MKTKRRFCVALGSTGAAMLLVALLGACLLPSSVTITGTAAGGLAIAGGAISVKCQGGAGTETTTTNPNGTYAVTFRHGAPPCMVQVVDPATSVAYYSAVTFPSTVANVTPLTTLVLANALGQDPAGAFVNFSGSVAVRLNPFGLAAAIVNVSTALRTALNINIDRVDPLVASFTAASEGSSGSALDQSIDQLMTVLNNANVPLSTLTAALTSSTSPASASAALSSIVAADHIATTTLAGCPYAPSGNYLVAGPGSTSFSQLTIDFGAMVATIASTGQTFAIASTAGSPCAYTLTSSEGVVTSIAVAQSGIAAGGVAPSTTSFFPAPTLLSNQGFYILIPVQPLTVADMPVGIFNGAVFAQSIGVTNQPWENYFFQYGGSGSVPGAGTYVVCSGATSCTGATGTYTTSGPNADGTFTETVPEAAGATIFTSANYRSASGDFIGVQILKSSPVWASWIQVFAQRASAFVPGAPGGTFSNNFWILSNNDATGTHVLQQFGVYQAVTIDAVGASPVSQTRTNQYSITDTIDFNDPFAGMLLRPAVASESQPQWAGVTALGLNVFGSTQTGTSPAGGTVPVFWGVSILAP